MTDIASPGNDPAQTASPDSTLAPSAPSEPIWTRQTFTAGGVLALLVALADVLFWPREPGISLMLYALALVAAVLVLHPHKRRDPPTVWLTLVAVLAALPLGESENIVWALFVLGAVSLLALAGGGYLGAFEDWLGRVVRFTLLAPARLLVDGFRLMIEAGQQKVGGRLVRTGLVWIVPLGCAAVFAALFVSANPVLEDGLRAIRLEALFQLLDPLRVMLWGFFAVISWPLLAPKLLPWAALPEMQGPRQPAAESLVFGATAIRNSLIVFNAIFAVQTLMDLAYLWGGLRLPDDLTYADYAHRGAYPLIATALLAAAFVLVAMRRNGPGTTSPLIRALVYAWVAQNIWLVISSILRLWIYVEAYGLSEMRIAAAVWMGLVAVGLALIIVKITLARSNRWLVMANLTALMLTLWGVAWLNIPLTIATFNLEHSRDVLGSGFATDTYYMQELGPQVIPAIDAYLRKATFADADTLKTMGLLRDNLAEPLIVRDLQGKADPVPPPWQSWTWRMARLQDYLKTQPFAPDPISGDK